MTVQTIAASAAPTLDRRTCRVRLTWGRLLGEGPLRPLITVLPAARTKDRAADRAVITLEAGQALPADALSAIAGAVSREGNAVIATANLQDAYAAFLALGQAAGFEVAA